MYSHRNLGPNSQDQNSRGEGAPSRLPKNSLQGQNRKQRGHYLKTRHQRNRLHRRDDPSPSAYSLIKKPQPKAKEEVKPEPAKQ